MVFGVVAVPDAHPARKPAIGPGELLADPCPRVMCVPDSVDPCIDVEQNQLRRGDTPLPGCCKRACGREHARADVLKVTFAEQSRRRDVVELGVHALEPGLHH